MNLQKLISRIFFVLFLISRSLLVHGQQVDSNTLNDAVPIEFDFKEGKFNQIIPFDDIYTIHYKNIPRSARHVSTRILLLNKNDYRAHFNNSAHTIIEDSFLAKCKSIQLKTIERGHDFTDSEAKIPVVFTMRPNKKYLFEIIADSPSKLTSTEEAELAKKIEENHTIDSIIKRTVNFHLSNPNVSYTSLSDVLKTINTEIARAVKKINNNYTLNTDTKDIEKLQSLKEFIGHAFSFRDNLRFLKKEITPSFENKTLKDSVIQDAIDTMSYLDWSSHDALNNNYLNLVFDSALMFARDTNIDNKAAIRQKIQILTKHKNEALHNLKDLYDTSYALIKETIVHNTYSLRPINATYPADFVRHARLYITLDIGAAYCRSIDRINTYSGVNIYFRPINKNVPLKQYTRFDDMMGVRTSLLLGVTLNSVANDKMRKGIIGNNALVIGAGFRITPFLKINGGGFVYYSYSTNPLVSKDKYHTSVAPFVSLSFDLDIKPLLGGIGEALFKPN